MMNSMPWIFRNDVPRLPPGVHVTPLNSHFHFVIVAACRIKPCSDFDNLRSLILRKDHGRVGSDADLTGAWHVVIIAALERIEIVTGLIRER
jgi:hypothetical protein